MRMHRKSRLDERLEECSDILTVADLKVKNMLQAAEIKEYLDWEKIFKNNNPVRLEIGCGKGKFVCETAQKNPDINFVAVEKISNVLIDACEKAKELKLTNVYFLNCAAEVLPKYFKDGSVEQIYLNFSNPLPKLGYAKQRLTHPRFLEEYKRLLKEGGKIIQKTDDGDFYKFSLESYRSCGYTVNECYEDLSKANLCDNVETEHEKLFKEMGRNIYYISVTK